MACAVGFAAGVPTTVGVPDSAIAPDAWPTDGVAPGVTDVDATVGAVALAAGIVEVEGSEPVADAAGVTAGVEAATVAKGRAAGVPGAADGLVTGAADGVA